MLPFVTVRHVECLCNEVVLVTDQEWMVTEHPIVEPAIAGMKVVPLHMKVSSADSLLNEVC